MLLFIVVLIAYVVVCISFVPRSRQAWTKPDGTVQAYRQRFGLTGDSAQLLTFIRVAYIVVYVLLGLVGIVLLLALAQFFLGGR